MSNLISRHGFLDDFFRDFSPGFFVKPLHGDALPSQIKLDVKETEQGYTLHAELPGVAKDDIHVTIDGPVVTLRAEVRQFDSQNKDERLLRSERYYGSVARSVQLPVDINEAEASAKYENGILTLTLPKRATAKGSRRVAIE
jgi:HSP20 family protein